MTANTRAEHRWGLVDRVVRFPEGFIVAKNWAGRAVRWLPESGFESSAADRFVELARAAGVTIEDQR